MSALSGDPWAAPAPLAGVRYALEPLDFGHVDDLTKYTLGDEVWRWIEPAPVGGEGVRALIEEAHDEQRRGLRLAWAVIDRAAGCAVGSTSFIDVSRAHRHVEIGWTWIGRAWWGMGANTEAKVLLLRHAFNQLNVVRVAIKTDSANTRSRRAIERLGFQHEGLFRHHRIRPDGTLRDSIWFSMVPAEWEASRGRLLPLISTQ